MNKIIGCFLIIKFLTSVLMTSFPTIFDGSSCNFLKLHTVVHISYNFLQSMTITDSEKAEFFRKWDESSMDLETYNNQIKDKVSKIELILERSKWELENKVAEDEYNAHLEQKRKQSLRSSDDLEREIHELENKTARLKVQILSDKKIHELEKSNIELKTKLDNSSKKLQEVKQGQLLLTKKMNSKEETSFVMMKKHYMLITITCFMMGGFVGISIFYENNLGDNYVMLVDEPAKSKYLIQNLRGDTLATWFPWMLAASQTLHVNILDNDLDTQERIDVIKNTINSKETLDIDNSFTSKNLKETTTYYKGWAGALQIAAQQNTELVIPQSFEFSNSKRPIGDIIVELSSLSDPDGYSGYTKSIVDGGEILKSHIIIYDVNSISNDKLSIIMMHEFGHALGLAHSSAPDDLMYPVIETDFPYISECMIDAIAGLYDGIDASEVECQN